MMRSPHIVASLAVLAAGAALAGPPRLDAIVLSDVKGGTHKTSFGTLTPKVFLTTKIIDPAPGMKVRAEWIAENTSGAAPPNYRIDKFELPIVAQKNPVANFSLGKPSAGWPVGDYRVDLFVNGKKANEVKFKMK